MRIAFMGKGGSGKSTISAGFIKYLSKDKKVLAIDADINMHLSSILMGKQSKQDPFLLGDIYTLIAEYVKGSREDFKTLPEIGSVPPTKGSKFIFPDQQDEFINKYSQSNGNISLLTIGTYNSDELGSSCFHSKLNSLELIYNHLLDNDDNYVITDSVAGIDSVATSVFHGPDLTIFVVEPTDKSLTVYHRYLGILASNSNFGDKKVKVVINKFEEGDEDFIKKNFKENEVIAIFKRSSAIRKFEQGELDSFQTFTTENVNNFEQIIKSAKSINRNWDEYLSRVQKLFEKECKSWVNKKYGYELDKTYDRNFNYESVISRNV